jgi:hypothetical protein
MTDACDRTNEPVGPPAPIATWDVLRSLGFTEDRSLISDPPGGLKKDFGNLKMSAIHCVTLRFQPVVMLSGVMTTPRTITQVECETPQELESKELGVPWVTWCLDDHAGGEFRPAIPTTWLAEGRQHRHLLPWERKRAAYASGPHCVAERDWGRLALRSLAEQLAKEADDAPIVFWFDGEVLTIRCGGRVIALPASGVRWPSGFSLPARLLHRLPKRITNGRLMFQVRDDLLVIGNKCYRGVVKVAMEKAP